MPESSESAGPSRATSPSAWIVEERVVLPVALHARPAGALVRAMASFDADVEVGFGERTANARGILGVLGLGVTAGSTVVIRATGPAAVDAARAAVEILVTDDEGSPG